MLFTFNFYSQNDSIIEFCYKAATEKNDTSKIILFYQTGNLYLKYNLDSAAVYFDKGLKMSEMKKFLKGKALCLTGKAQIFDKKKEYSKALDFFHKASEDFKNLKDTINLIVCYDNIAKIHFLNKNYNPSIAYLTLNLDLNLKIKDSLKIAKIYNNIGNVYTKKKNIPKATEYHLKSLEIKKNLKESLGNS
jgi:tetratricopeptide (TPR) repeat protein